MNILEIKNLSVTYTQFDGSVLKALDDVSLDIIAGQTLAIAGESGSGKSTLALALLGLINNFGGKITSGNILFEGLDLLTVNKNILRTVRGGKIAMVFQDPYSSLNPVLTIGLQITETIKAHNKKLSNKEIANLALETLELCTIKNSSRIFNSYPHQISGGQRQRVAIAMAICNNPQILIADEVTTALDVTTQKEIMDLLDSLKAKLNMSIILITHNLALAFKRSQRTAIMQNGKIIELQDTTQLFLQPQNIYTKLLINSTPVLGKKVGAN